MAPPGRTRLAKSRIIWSRLAWFVVLYAVGLGAFSAIVYALRALVPR
jgi:hypothetical protein